MHPSAPPAAPPAGYANAVGDFTPGGGEVADTAALLRELSSLGLDDAPPFPVPRAPVLRSAAVGDGGKGKRKSIFGR